MPVLRVPIQRIDQTVPIPTYARGDDAGVDLVTTTDVRLRPGERVVVGTGIAVALPPGYAGFVHPRSGLAARAGLSLVNTPGTIDAGYRGEIRVCLINQDPVQPIVLAAGDRIAQLVVQQVVQVEFVETGELAESDRGAAGYGSTGGHAGLAHVAHTERGTIGSADVRREPTSRETES